MLGSAAREHMQHVSLSPPLSLVFYKFERMCLCTLGSGRANVFRMKAQFFLSSYLLPDLCVLSIVLLLCIVIPFMILWFWRRHMDRK